MSRGPAWDAAWECRHGRVPFDPSPVCGCFGVEGPVSWGHKITFVVYVEGDRVEEAVSWGVEALDGAIPEAVSVGVCVEVVEDEPKGQAA